MVGGRVGRVNPQLAPPFSASLIWPRIQWRRGRSSPLIWPPAGIGFGDGEAEGFEFGDEFAQAAVVVEPGAVVGQLLVGQDAG
jgi:hypothetical protein